MNKFQKQENTKIKFLWRVWWIAQGESYTSFRRTYRKLSRELNNL